MKTYFLSKALGASMIAACIAALASVPALAAGPDGQRSAIGASVTIKRTAWGEVRTVTRQGPSGQVIVSESTRSWDRGAHMATDAGWRLGRNGERVRFERTVKHLDSGGVRIWETVTLPDGRMRMAKVTRHRVGPGAWQVERVVTDARGRNTLHFVSETRSGGVWTRVDTVRRPDGAVETRTRQAPARVRTESAP